MAPVRLLADIGQADTLWPKDMITHTQLTALLPSAAEWAKQMENIILAQGEVLSAVSLADARSIGVQSPERVRVVAVERMPLPDDPVLQNAAIATGLLSPSTAGLSLRYGILIRIDAWNNRHLIAHELVHTLQYERLGGFSQFLEKYLLECITPPGYPHGPLESEAAFRSAEVCS